MVLQFLAWCEACRQEVQVLQVKDFQGREFLLCEECLNRKDLDILPATLLGAYILDEGFGLFDGLF